MDIQVSQGGLNGHGAPMAKPTIKHKEIADQSLFYYREIQENGLRKYHKNQCLELLSSIEDAHREIDNFINKKHIDEACQVLEDCQRGAIQIGTTIDNFEGEGTEAVHTLEEYCETVYGIHEDLCNGKLTSRRQIEKKLRKIINKAKREIKDLIPTQYEAVFLPYKASMWDSLESVWKAADADENTTAYVICVPYYDKNPDGSYKQLHYEGDEFPDYVPITHYTQYDMESRHPDIIYIHNGYDDINYVTEVMKDFHTGRLKECTDELVYIPYFVLQEPDFDAEWINDFIKDNSHFVLIPGVLNADKVIVQSEAMKKVYVRVLTDYAGKEMKSSWEKKIEGTGSPKFDRVLSLKKEDFEIPDDWQRIIKKKGGTDKKIIFYNTSVGSLLTYGTRMLKKMRDVFQIFYENREDIVLLWRPHPLLESTISSMMPSLRQEYDRLVQDFKKSGWGIYDDSSDIDRAIVISDAYYGDLSSVVWLCQKVGMPIMIQEPRDFFTTEYLENKEKLWGYIRGNCTLHGEVDINIVDEKENNRAKQLLQVLREEGRLDFDKKQSIFRIRLLDRKAV